MNLRTKNLIIPMDQRIDQHLTNGLIRVITAFFAGHTTDAPRVFAVVANKIFRILQQRDQTSDDSASVQTELLTESDVASAFTQDGAADALRSLSYGEAAAVQINSSTLLLMVRVDPLSVSSLDDLRSQILSDMKGGELDDALAAGGAELAHDLDSSAMNKLPAKKIVNNSANS